MIATLQNMLEAELIRLNTKFICIGTKIQEIKTKYSLKLPENLNYKNTEETLLRTALGCAATEINVL